jgi:hypothetical protein
MMPRQGVASMYLRFVIAQLDPDSTRRQGVFVAGYELLDSNEISAEDRDELRRVLDWFKINLPVPKKHKTAHAIFWFKSGASDATRKIWELVHLLRRYEHQVDLIRTDRPGYIVYEDGLQVGAIPFNDTL